MFDGRLEALDAKTGEVVWSVVTVDQSKPYTITGAPRVVKDKVMIGNGGAELGVRGYVSAYDTDSGELVWRFYTVPNPDKAPDGAVSDEARRAWPMTPGVIPVPGSPTAVAVRSGMPLSTTTSTTRCCWGWATARPGTPNTRPGQRW